MSWDNSGGGAWNERTSDKVVGTSQDGSNGFRFSNDARNNTGYAVSTNDAANDGDCYNCGEPGHIKSECPQPRATAGLCYNCGEPGHSKAECQNAAVAREFTGTCRLCEETGHRAADCPSSPRKLCNNCGHEGHSVVECKAPRKIDRSHIPDVLPEISWKELELACQARDMDDVKEAIEKYLKALPMTTYIELEMGFRNQDLGVYLIALRREITEILTLMDLQGNLEREYVINWRFSDKPQRPKEREGWPDTEENLERLKNAGDPVDRLIPKCSNCNILGHIAKSCPEEKGEAEHVTVKCYNCDEEGHRVRDCPNPRPDKFACRNCKQSGHSSKECSEPRSAESVECNKCSETGHFARDCPTGGGGDTACRNCGQEGHRAKDCTEERVITCRNCDETGHMSKECPKPRDYSRVKCSNCQQMGHTKVRCKEPLVDEDGAVRYHDGGSGYDTGSKGIGPDPADIAEGNNWGSSTPAAVVGESSDW